MGDIYVAIVRAGEILAKWRDGIEKAVSEGETVLEISEARLPTLSTPAQVLALHVVDLVEVDVNRIELPEEKSKEERAVEITENILENTVIAEPVQIMYLHGSSSDEAGGESSNTDDDDEFDEMKGSATKTELSGLPSDNKWSVAFGMVNKERPSWSRRANCLAQTLSSSKHITTRVKSKDKGCWQKKKETSS
jgi:hypothetical protein